MLNHQHKQHFSFPLLQNVLNYINKVQVFEELIPFLWEQAANDVIFENHLQPSMPVVTIKKSECLPVLSKAFFCLYHRISYDWKDFPSINFDRLYVHSREFDGREKPKLQMNFPILFNCINVIMTVLLLMKK